MEEEIELSDTPEQKTVEKEELSDSDSDSELKELHPVKNPEEENDISESENENSEESESNQEFQQKETKKKRKSKKKAKEENAADDLPQVDKEVREQVEAIFRETMKPRNSSRKTEEEKAMRRARCEERIKNLLKQMEEANSKDQKSFQLHKPPFARVQYIKEISKAICDQKLTKILINDFGRQFLDLLCEWITPFQADKSVYPSIGLRLEVYKIIEKLPINKEFLQIIIENRNSGSDIPDIVQVLQNTPTKQGSEDQIIIGRILDRWLRMIVTNPEIEANRETITEDGLEMLREAAKNPIIQVDEREMRLEQKAKKLRRAAGVQQQDDAPIPKRFVVAPKSRKKRRD